MASRPQIDVAVLMRREAVQGPMSRWQAWRWVLADVAVSYTHLRAHETEL
jgi:hypothetical protein